MSARASTPARALALLGGLALLVLASAGTFGFALAAPVGMLVAAGVYRLRRRSYSRGGGWIGAVAGTAIAAGVAFAFVMHRVPPGVFESARKDAIAERRRHPPRVPRLLQRIAPPSPAAPLIQAETDSLANTPTFFWTAAVVGGIMACGLLGAVVGSMGWGGATLVAFGILGRWPGGRRDPPEDAADYAPALTG